MAHAKTIDCDEDVAAALAELVTLDTRIEAVIAAAGHVPLRRSPPGFEGLVRIIIAQQVSKASAAAITERTIALLDPFTPQAFLTSSDESRAQMGLSRPKQRALHAVSDALVTGDLDLDAVTQMPASEAIRTLTEVKGIGPWTAEVYLVFCAGHPDIFPAGDLALQIASHEAFGLEARPSEKSLRAMAESWAPWRAVAARLLWSWYANARNRDVMP